MIKSSGMNIFDLTAVRLPSELWELALEVGRRAEARGWRAFLVGGVVRDWLLGRPSPDLDIAVEGDAPELASDFPGKATVHRRFGTATVYLHGRRLDLATARSETYERPGALPSVRPGTIVQDLYRRDFTINAMAASLSPASPGELLDPFRGLEDLREGLVRILHPRSFIDDATRILRAIRYEQRLDFRIEADTLTLLARDLSMLETISADRLRHELELFLREELPEKAFSRAQELGVLPRLYPPLKGDGWLAEKFRLARRERSPFPLYLCLLAYRMTSREAQGFVRRFNFPKNESRLILGTVALKERLSLLPTRPSSLYLFLRDFPPLAIKANALAASPEVGRRLELYLERLRSVRTVLKGDDLLRLGVPPGPAVGQVLRQLLLARLDGEINTREEEMAAVRRLLASGTVTEAQD